MDILFKIDTYKNESISLFLSNMNVKKNNFILTEFNKFL
jgi:hypothetical protein